MPENNVKIKYKLFHINPEYYTFLSGALVSLPLTLLFEAADNYHEVAYWLALITSLVTSFFCFQLSIILQDVHDEYKRNASVIRNNIESWNVAFAEKKNVCIIFFVLTFLTLMLTLILVFQMQFIDSTIVDSIDVSTCQALNQIKF